MNDRRNFNRWEVWHERFGYGLLAILLVIAIYFFLTAQWVGGALTIPLVAFVLWTLHHGR